MEDKSMMATTMTGQFPGFRKNQLLGPTCELPRRIWLALCGTVNWIS